MAEPQIQYAQTSDGVSIAFWVMGTGRPLLYLPPIWQHAQLDWQIPSTRGFLEWLSSRFRLVRVDPRNSGMSQRGVEDVSLEAGERDLAAVADRLGLEEFSLFGHGLGGNTAIAFTGDHPQRVRRLVINNAMLTLGGISPTPALRALGLLLQHDWDTFTETAAGMVFGWGGESGEAHLYAAMLRESVTWEDAKRWGAGRYEVSKFLPHISCPTLVMHQRDGILTSIETGRRLAAQIPNARLVAVEGQAMQWSDPAMSSALDAFFDDGEAVARSGAGTTQAIQSGTAIILFADIVDSTALTERMGDSAFRERARALDDALRKIIAESSGTTIDAKTLGDGVLATFSAASQAIDAALRCAAAGDAQGLLLHVGLHAGDVIREDGNVFGGAVNIAARISALSAAGEVLVSDIVRGLARTSAGVTFKDRGEHALKGVAEPQRVFAVRTAEAG